MPRPTTPGDRVRHRTRSLRRLLPAAAASAGLVLAASTWVSHQTEEALDAPPVTTAVAADPPPDTQNPLDTSRITPPVASDGTPITAFGLDGSATVVHEAPPAGVGASATPIGYPPVVTESPGYAFAATQDESSDPVAFDPCRPVHYVVRGAGAPPNGEQLIEEAVAAVSAATGLQFIDDGPTDEAPAVDRDPYQPETYGPRWAPVLFTWSEPAETPELAESVVGLGGGVHRADPDGLDVYVSGHVILDGPELTGVARAFGGPDEVRTTIMHELAHVVGLGHIDDPEQLMHPMAGELTGFAAGDLTGLARLGAGQCAPDL